MELARCSGFRRTVASVNNSVGEMRGLRRARRQLPGTPSVKQMPDDPGAHVDDRRAIPLLQQAGKSEVNFRRDVRRCIYAWNASRADMKIVTRTGNAPLALAATERSRDGPVSVRQA
jgi:hypothetical protein